MLDRMWVGLLRSSLLTSHSRVVGAGANRGDQSIGVRIKVMAGTSLQAAHALPAIPNRQHLTAQHAVLYCGDGRESEQGSRCFPVLLSSSRRRGKRGEGRRGTPLGTASRYPRDA
jgi:hypothetical protein